MPIVTLISDLGTTDYYVAAVKGAILSQCPQAVLVDISHNISPFDLIQTAYNVKNVFNDFPIGTIHLVGIEPEFSPDAKYLIALHQGHYFVACDNGVFSLIFDEFTGELFEIDLDGLNNSGFPTRDILGTISGKLAKGDDLLSFAKPIDSYLKLGQFNPTSNSENIKGIINYIDSFGNAFTNISRTLFEETAKNRRFEISFSGIRRPITKIARNYYDVPQGESLALFSAANYLQVAINKGADGVGGSASQLLGIKTGNSVTIEFKD